MLPILIFLIPLLPLLPSHSASASVSTSASVSAFVRPTLALTFLR